MNVHFIEVIKKFGSTLVVDRLNLQIEAGEFIVLLGPSGCGKTTTLRMLAGLEEATAGDILIGGHRVNDIPARQRDIAMVFQNYALYPHLSVADNIAYPLKIRKISRPQIGQRVASTAALLEIEHLLGRKPRELSGGERQRVALARAIVREPRVYLMDEPLSNLDARLRVQMRGELKRLQHELGTTTIYVTHDQAEAMTLAHRVAVLRAGVLQQFDTPMTLYNRPANRFVAQFVGSPGMNFIEGRVDGSARQFVGQDFALPLNTAQLERLKAQERVTLGLRPEHLRVTDVKQVGSLPATVHVSEAMGNETFVFLRLGGAKLIARAEADFHADMETRVGVQLETNRAHFFHADSGDAISESSIRDGD